MKKGNRFGEFIAKLRNEKNISQEKLCEGLCTYSMLSRFERGEREPEKLLQNRFLTRLGVVPENYENFLYYKEYCRWEKRQGIIHHILEENIERAKELLEAYRQEYDMEYALEKQFYLAMLVQIRRYEGCEDAQLAEQFGQALELTVPDLGRYGFRNRILSLEELNLLLEFYYCSGESLNCYEELLEYIEKMESTLLALAKIYPKTVYYYYKAWNKSDEQKDLANRMLELCDKAIELLRNANRMFYLWELFCMKEQLMPVLPVEVRTNPEVQKHLNECCEWRTTLEEIYREFGVSIAMYEFCYLYVESENYCIGDVIRIRWKMLGLSQRRLCEGICDERTVSKLERNLSRPQRDVVQQLFDRLNLSTELCRTELVTDSQEAIEKYKELQHENNNHNYEVVNNLIEELRNLVSLEIASNRQLLLRNNCINRYNHGNISSEKYVREMKSALECTVPYSRVKASREKYLTNEEIACIHNMTLKIASGYVEMEECISILKDLCEMPRYPINYLRMYEFIMASISSYLGNCGEYKKSDEIKNMIVRVLLKNRKICGIHEALYGKVWNRIQENRNNKTVLRECRTELYKCIIISKLCNDNERKLIYEARLQKMLIICD